MKLLADENAPRSTLRFLKSIGLNVAWMGPVIEVLSGVEVTSLADERVVLTENSDFLETLSEDKSKNAGRSI